MERALIFYSFSSSHINLSELLMCISNFSILFLLTIKEIVLLPFVWRRDPQPLGCDPVLAAAHSEVGHTSGRCAHLQLHLWRGRACSPLTQMELCEHAHMPLIWSHFLPPPPVCKARKVGDLWSREKIQGCFAMEKKTLKDFQLCTVWRSFPLADPK